MKNIRKYNKIDQEFIHKKYKFIKKVRRSINLITTKII